MRKRSMAIPLAAACAAALPVTVASGAAAASAGPLVSGVVTAHGVPVTGVPVRLYAWPSQSALAKADRPGEKVPVVLVGSAVTGSDGNYSITVKRAALRPEATDGTVNLEADAGGASYDFPYVLARDGGDSFLVREGVTRPLRVNLADPIPEERCGPWVWQRHVGAHFTHVGQTYSPHAGGISQDFTYDVSQSSAIGVGISGTGKDGSFHSDGTRSVSATAGQAFGAAGGYKNAWYWTEFIYNEDKSVCQHGFAGIRTYHKVMATGFAGGTRITRPRASSSPYCVPERHGSTFWRELVRARGWSGGVSIGYPFGVTLSAQTGYDADGHVRYHFRKSRWLCGTNTYPGEARQSVVRLH